MADKQMMILYLQKMLMDTDEKHTLNATQICERMDSQYHLPCDRRTIYEEIKRLLQFGMKIEKASGRGAGYYLKERDFELPELKLLVDAVQSSKFITKEKTEELIKKLEKQTNSANAAELQRYVFILNRIKAGNDAIYANVDAIHKAIRDNRQICFKYCRWTLKKELVPMRKGEGFAVSPWALSWDDENYYLVAYDAEAGIIKHYRVDKMQEVSVTENERLGKESFQNFDLAAYARKTFGMFSGEDRRVTLEGDNRLVGVVIDRFGTDIMIHPINENSFHATVTVSVSQQFFGWLSGLGKGMRISWPEDVREAYRAHLKDILEN